MGLNQDIVCLVDSYLLFFFDPLSIDLDRSLRKIDQDASQRTEFVIDAFTCVKFGPVNRAIGMEGILPTGHSMRTTAVRAVRHETLFVVYEHLGILSAICGWRPQASRGASDN